MQALMERLNGLFLATTANNWISFLGWLVAVGTLIWGVWSSQRQHSRARRVELQENYLKLELESNAVFRYEAEHGAVLSLYKGPVKPAKYGKGVDEATLLANESIADNFYLQQLNLFEIAARFRRDRVFAAPIFGSWVIWYYGVSRSWWFRERWRADYSENYTDDLYYIFTPMVEFIDAAGAKAPIPDSYEEEIKALFFEHVAVRFKCPIVPDLLKRGESGSRSRSARAASFFGRPIRRLAWRIGAWFKDSQSLGPKSDELLKKLAAGLESGSGSTPPTSPTVKSSKPSAPTESTGPQTASSASPQKAEP